jgi:hypothetical protein
MIKRLIREKLIETKINKKNLVVEDKIVRSKFKFLFENHNLHTKRHVNVFFINMLVEMVQLYKKGYNPNVISENVTNVFDVLKNLFGGSENKVVEVFKQKGIDWILEKLEISSNDSLGEYLRDVLNQTELSEVPQLLSDCNFLSKKIAQSVKENYLKDLEDTQNSKFMIVVKDAFHNVVQNSDVETRLESNIYNIICPLIDEIETKFEEQLANMKSKLVGGENSTIDIEDQQM